MIGQSFEKPLEEMTLEAQVAQAQEMFAGIDFSALQNAAPVLAALLVALGVGMGVLNKKLGNGRFGSTDGGVIKAK